MSRKEKQKEDSVRIYVSVQRRKSMFPLRVWPLNQQSRQKSCAGNLSHCSGNIFLAANGSKAILKFVDDSPWSPPEVVTELTRIIMGRWMGHRLELYSLPGTVPLITFISVTRGDCGWALEQTRATAYAAMCTPLSLRGQGQLSAAISLLGTCGSSRWSSGSWAFASRALHRALWTSFYFIMCMGAVPA